MLFSFTGSMNANNIVFNYRLQLVKNKYNLHFLYAKKGIDGNDLNFIFCFLLSLRKVCILYHGKAVVAPLASDIVSFLVFSPLL